MSTKYKAPTKAEIAALDATVGEAQKAHDEAVAEHERAVQAAADSEQALIDMEDAAANGEDVHPDEHGRAASTARLLARRPSRLAPAVESTREALDAAKFAAGKARADVIAADIPDPAEYRQAAIDAVRKWREAEAQRSDKVREVSDEVRTLLGLETRNRFGQVIQGFNAGGRRHDAGLPVLEFDAFDKDLEAQRSRIISEYKIRTRL